MLARCPQCQTRFRLAPEKIGPQGARIRCSRCQTVFRVGPPDPAMAGAQPAPPAQQPPAAPPAVPRPAAAPGPPSAAARSQPMPAPAASSSASGGTPQARVLVAEANPARSEAIVQMLARWGLAAYVVQSGAEALLCLHRHRPPAAFLGSHLPGVASPAIVEIVRRTAELSSVRLVRLDGGDERPAAPEFEAEHTVSLDAIPAGLEPVIKALELGGSPAGGDAGFSGASTGSTRGVGSAPAPQSANPEVTAAERLARIIISDIILYNEEKFKAGVANGNVAAALETELAEASVLFRQRVSEELRAQRDFLLEELERRGKRS